MPGLRWRCIYMRHRRHSCRAGGMSLSSSAFADSLAANVEATLTFSLASRCFSLGAKACIQSTPCTYRDRVP